MLERKIPRAIVRRVDENVPTTSIGPEPVPKDMSVELARRIWIAADLVRSALRIRGIGAFNSPIDLGEYVIPRCASNFEPIAKGRAIVRLQARKCRNAWGLYVSVKPTRARTSGTGHELLPLHAAPDAVRIPILMDATLLHRIAEAVRVYGDL